MNYAVSRIALACLPIAAVAVAADKPASPPQDPPGIVRMSDEQRKTIGLKTARVEPRAITEPVRVPGTIAFDQGHVAILHPLAQALVLRLLVQPGDAVRPGQPLAELDAPALAAQQANLAAAQAMRAELLAAVAVARDALHRAEILSRDGSLPRAEVERRRLVLIQAEAAVKAAEARNTALSAQIARLDPGERQGVSRLVSPIAGVVVSIGVTPGELVETTGSAITVADLSVVLVKAQVPEASIPLLATGDPARVTVAAGGKRVWEGRVVALGAELDPNSRTLPARVQLANADNALRAGMTVNVTLTSDRNRQDLVVPADAVQSVADKHVAFTDEGGGRFMAHDLVLGVQEQDWSEVQKGLTAGDTVVTAGSFELKALLQKSMLGGQ